MNKRVPEEMLKGNMGEAFAQYILSKSALVRPVVSGTDIGIDLYCESIVRSEPFQHFWVQVKSSANFPNSLEIAKHAFRTVDLVYWAKQPVPVLAFLVPIPQSGEALQFIHVVDVTMNLITSGINQGQDSQSVASSKELILQVNDEAILEKGLDRLLYEHVPYVVSAMYASRGIVYPIPTPDPTYTKTVAVEHLVACQSMIVKNMLTTSALFVANYLDKGADIGSMSSIFEATLNSKANDPHYEIPEALGRIEEAKGNRTAAADHYKRSIKLINEDTNLDKTKPPWSDNLRRLEYRLDGLNK